MAEDSGARGREALTGRVSDELAEGGQDKGGRAKGGQPGRPATGLGADARMSPAAAPAPEAPPLTHRDYAAFAKQPDAQLAASCQVETFHASGPGGQGVNTADSAVRMRHLPTGIAVVSRSERSQLLNRQACLAKLRAELERRARVPKARKATRVPHRSKERRLEAKRRVGEKKALRGRMRGDEEG